MNKLLVTFISLLLTLQVAAANQADVIDVKASQVDDKTWRFDVTLKHDDEGWDHYANQWVVTDLDNKILATRTLYHPHVHEQPFTRSLQGVKIPKKTTQVKIIARDSVHARTGKVIEYDLKEMKIIEDKDKTKENKNKNRTKNVSNPDPVNPETKTQSD